jgi:hypothetical protein
MVKARSLSHELEEARARKFKFAREIEGLGKRYACGRREQAELGQPDLDLGFFSARRRPTCITQLRTIRFAGPRTRPLMRRHAHAIAGSRPLLHTNAYRVEDC